MFVPFPQKVLEVCSAQKWSLSQWAGLLQDIVGHLPQGMWGVCTWHMGCLHMAWGMFAPGLGGMSVLKTVNSFVHWLDVLPLAPEHPMLPDSFGLSDAIPGPQKPFLKYLFWLRP